jgi:hypothetical protein
MERFTSLAEARRAQIAWVQDASIQDQTVSGRNLIEGLGTSLFHVNFPVLFSSKPFFAPGAVLDPRNPFATVAATLRWSATVAGYDVVGAIEGAFDGYFTGAWISAWISGVEGQLTWIDWSFHGPALRNPVDADNVEVL